MPSPKRVEPPPPSPLELAKVARQRAAYYQEEIPKRQAELTTAIWRAANAREEMVKKVDNLRTILSGHVEEIVQAVVHKEVWELANRVESNLLGPIYDIKSLRDRLTVYDKEIAKAIAEAEALEASVTEDGVHAARA